MHFRAYARAPVRDVPSVANVLGEARRDPGYCDHISDPRPPIVHYGEPVEGIEPILDDRLRGARDRRMRALPRSFPVLLAGVASWPVERLVVQASETEQHVYEAWLERNVEFFRAQFGDDLISIVEHVDERYPHLHVFAAAHQDPASRVYTLETIWAPMAQEGAKRRSKSKRSEQRQAFRAEAKKIQGAYYDSVGAPSGLARYGPRRQRLTREEWRAQSEQAKALSELAARLAKRKEEIEEEVRLRAQSLAKSIVETRVGEITAIANRRLAEARDFTGRVLERNRALENRLLANERENQRLRSLLLDAGINPDASSGLTPL